MLYSPYSTSPGKFFIVAGMIIASILGAMIYSNSPHSAYTGPVCAAFFLEMFAYGVFIFFSGGFSSPYLWYFVSTVTFLVSFFPGKIKLLPISWCLFCAVYQARYWDAAYDDVLQLKINIGLGFLVVVSGFYMLYDHAKKLELRQQALHETNQSLIEEQSQREKNLHHTLDIYDSMHLFGIADADRVRSDLVRLLHRTIAPTGCALIQTGAGAQIEYAEFLGLSAEEESELREAAAQLLSRQPQGRGDAEEYREVLTRSGKDYHVSLLFNLSDLQGLFIARAEADAEYGEYRRFYLHLAAVFLGYLKYHKIAEDTIINSEQNRIAAEIHDTVLQKIFGATCSLRLIQTQENGLAPEALAEQLQQIEALLCSVMKELREAINGDYWGTDTVSFSQRLEDYMQEIRLLRGVDIQLDIDKNHNALTINQKTAFYRVICEAVNNAIRHGQADRITVALKITTTNAVAEIADNGVGIVGPREEKGSGLKNMYYIATLLKGRLSVISTPNAVGTMVQLSLPR